MKKILYKFMFVMFILLSISTVSQAKTESTGLSYSTLSKMNKNSMERYVYSMALSEGENYEKLLIEERKNDKALRVPDEYIDYITKSANSGRISTNLGPMTTIITTEAKVVRGKTTGKIIRVEDFGHPYASISGYNSEFQHGGFNINRNQSPKSARFSATDQFIIHAGRLSVGMDIISYSVNLGAKTRPITVVANMSF